MNLRLALTAVCLFGIGLFSKAQLDNSKVKSQKSKPVIENGPDAIPVTVKSSPRKQKLREGTAQFTPPEIVKDGDKKLPPPPPPPMEAKKATAPKKELPPPPPPPKAPKHKD